MAHALDLSLRSYAAQPLCHSHAFHQIVMAVDGVLEMEVGGTGDRVAGCQAALVAAGQRHSCAAAGENAFLVLDWRAEDAGTAAELSRLSDLAARRPFLAYDPGLRHLVCFLGSELRRSSDAAAARGWGGLLLSAMAARTAAAAAQPRQIARAIAYIRASHRQRLSVEEIARAACCSAGHLHALFQRYLGLTPMDYLTEVRLDRAMSRLAQSDEAIGRIAWQTGHADQSVLTRSMKRRRGVTPADYRRSARATVGTA